MSRTTFVYLRAYCCGTDRYTYFRIFGSHSVYVLSLTHTHRSKGKWSIVQSFVVHPTPLLEHYPVTGLLGWTKYFCLCRKVTCTRRRDGAAKICLQINNRFGRGFVTARNWKIVFHTPFSVSLHWCHCLPWITNCKVVTIDEAHILDSLSLLLNSTLSLHCRYYSITFPDQIGMYLSYDFDSLSLIEFHLVGGAGRIWKMKIRVPVLLFAQCWVLTGHYWINTVSWVLLWNFMWDRNRWHFFK